MAILVICCTLSSEIFFTKVGDEGSGMGWFKVIVKFIIYKVIWHAFNIDLAHDLDITSSLEEIKATEECNTANLLERCGKFVIKFVKNIMVTG